MEIEIDRSLVSDSRYHEERRKRLYKVGNIILNQYGGLSIVSKIVLKNGTDIRYAYTLISLKSVNTIGEETFNSIDELSKNCYEQNDRVVEFTNIAVVDY